MPDLCLYLQAHQPYRLRPYRLFDVGTGRGWFDDDRNRKILRRVAERCYGPANRVLAEAIDRSGGRFRVALGLTGTLLSQLAEWAPETLAGFRDLVATGGVELLAETRHHSLAGLADERELEAQVAVHAAELEATFGRRPTAFRDTELIWHDGLAATVARMGFRAVLVEGAPAALAFRSPDRVYESAAVPGLRMLPRNFRLSDDLGFRFTDRSWEGWPLDAGTWAGWVAGSSGESVHVYLDYETFGEHHGAESGILAFLEALPGACLERGVDFVLPSELAGRAPAGALSFPAPVSWADEDRGVTAWLGNRIQRAAHARLWALREPVLASADPDRIERWRRLTTSDHLYYMSTKGGADGRVHGRFRPFETPYDAFIAFMNVLQDLERELETSTGEPALAVAHSPFPTGGRIPGARSNPRPAALRWPAFG